MRAQPSSPQISARMKALKKSGSKIERHVGQVLRTRRLGYRKNVKDLPGSPDFANKSRRWAIFVNGCFWHHHTGCGRATVPKANRDFWTDKFRRNRKRDAKAVVELRRRGFRVAVVWECQRANIETKLREILETSGVDS